MSNHVFINALLRKPTPFTPIWIMRQAGRYLPEYRKVRESAGSFMNLCTNPELACEVTMQPLRRFDLDAAILFSDILTIPDAMGLGLHFVTGEGPKFERPLSSVADINNLAVPDIEQELGYVPAAVRTIVNELSGRLPLIGFTGSPWTLATYMVEGGSSKTFSKAKALLLNEPQAAHQLLNLLADTIIDYLNAQVAAGADALMIFDTWGGVLTPEAFETFGIPSIERILAGVDRRRNGQTIPIVVFTKGAGMRLSKMAELDCDGLGVDWMTDLAQARKLTGGKRALQGNLDPSTLHASEAVVRAEARKVLDSFGGGAGHVFNLGHGIDPGVNPDRVAALVDEVHRYSRR